MKGRIKQEEDFKFNYRGGFSDWQHIAGPVLVSRRLFDNTPANYRDLRKQLKALCLGGEIHHDCLIDIDHFRTEKMKYGKELTKRNFLNLDEMRKGVGGKN